MQNRLNILFAGGGTGGHLFPALAIAGQIKKLRPDAEITFIGTNGRIEARVVPHHGYAFRSLWISGLHRSWRFSNVLFPLKVVVALVQAFIALRKVKPQVVVGTGGYVCGPPVYAATLLGIPTLLQEQNSYPGITTRLLAERVDEVHVSFELTRKVLKRAENVILSGNPTRSELVKGTMKEGRSFFGLSGERQVLFVFGGSLGASSINIAVDRIVPDLLAHDVAVLWQTGERDYTQMSEKYREHSGRVVIRQFIDRMAEAYAASTLVLCRSGATTVAELACTGVPSILVPYPFAAADHQTENAKAMVENGASLMIRDDELHEKLLHTVTGLLGDQQQLRTMGERALALGKPDAAEHIAQAILRLAGD